MTDTEELILPINSINDDQDEELPKLNTCCDAMPAAMNRNKWAILVTSLAAASLAVGGYYLANYVLLPVQPEESNDYSDEREALVIGWSLISGSFGGFFGMGGSYLANRYCCNKRSDYIALAEKTSEDPKLSETTPFLGSK